jgi:hypothetical protein
MELNGGHVCVLICVLAQWSLMVDMYAFSFVSLLNGMELNGGLLQINDREIYTNNIQAANYYTSSNRMMRAWIDESGLMRLMRAWTGRMINQTKHTINKHPN